MLNAEQPETEQNQSSESCSGKTEASSTTTLSSEESLAAELTKLKLDYETLQTQYFESFAESQQQISKYSQLQTLIHNTSEGMILFNPDSTVLSFNLAAQTILGYAEIDVMYKPADHIFPHPDKYEGHLIQYLRDVNDCPEYKIFYAKHANGHEIPLRISISEVNSSAMMLFDDETEIDDNPQQPQQDFDLFAISFTDLTSEVKRQNKIEEQKKLIQQALEKAEEASRLKSEFIGNISHELRTPLNGILGLTELLLKSGLSDEQTEYMHNIHSSGKGLLTLVNNILEFTKNEANPLIQPETIQLTRIFKILRSEFAEQIETKGLTLVIKKQKEVPDKIELNNSGFLNMLRCLVDNAVKFTQKGCITVSLRLTKSQQQKDLVLTVSDTGIGIAPDEQKNIFKAFFQVDSSIRRTQGGLGLGLDIVNKIALSLDGTVQIQSALNKGAHFQITIPLEKVTVPLIDTEYIHQLQSDLGDTFNELIAIFTTDTANQLKELELLIQQQNFEKVRSLLLYLSGSATNIGAVRLKHHYTRLPAKLDNQSHAMLLKDYHELLATFDLTSHNLQQLLSP